MKVLLICGLVLAGAFLAEAEGGRELCGMTHEGIKGVLKCMAAQAPPQMKEKALGLIAEKGDQAAEIIKSKCESEVDFGQMVSLVFSEKVAEAIKEAYRRCKPPIAL
uniref:Putative microplusin n=1 Tax=Rhipicephalus microplus TaxID=6941 RepID=A0A6G5A615_RHIMP